MDDFDVGSWFDGDGYNFDTDSTFDSGSDNGLFDATGGLGYSGDYDFGDSSGQFEPDPYSPTNEFGSDVNNPSGGGLGSTTAGLGGFNWSSLINPALGAVSGYAQMEAKEKMNKEDWKAKTEFMKAQLAEQEKYYQLHGEQLKQSLGNFKQYAPQQGLTGNPFSAQLGGAQAPTMGIPSNQGLLSYGY